MSTVIVIPSRYGSSRFPGKPLTPIRGKSLLERVWRIAQGVHSADRVIVATDDERIREHAEAFGAEVSMTSQECRNGTERVYEALSSLKEKPELVVNLQGDAPLIPPEIVDALISKLKDDPEVPIATTAVKLNEEEYVRMKEERARGSSSGTFVVFGKDERALYFSKALIPSLRDGYVDGAPIYRHLGIYAFTWEGLKRYTALQPTPLESCEKLEQLRALESGMAIGVSIADLKGRELASVDAPADTARVEEIIDRFGEVT